ncbi:putative sam and ph domain-containing protein [Phaeomoniella chlamydospora]|uniref:Putative sam and ph domain-containing protein n=1 Tax=Phaeomoniella chlamydospora TaxID=158046 RepID=A0A0G2F2T3_PHACM|nr:putative sam and ph domain-containing protein [Phaeomoniella chlamydospora]
MSQASYASRPLSSATEFSDTDFEDDYPDEQFTARSASSQTTVSTVDSLKTPDTAGLGGFEFHFDDKQAEKSPSVENGEAVDLYFGISPNGNVPIELPAPASFQPNQLLRKPLSSRNDAADKLDEANVRSWTPEDVADWMCDAGHDDTVVDKFLDHDINGQILLDLQYEDLKELEITCHTKRNAVLDSIKYLRASSRISLAPMLPQEMLPKEENKSTSKHDDRPRSRRRRRHHATAEDFVSPGESVSIVAVEQVLPRPHNCSKGENCKKWKKQQAKLQQIREELQAMPHTPMTISTTTSRPSVTASSDVLGPSMAPPSSITRERLSELRPVDPQESVRQFLGFQHMSPTSPSSGALAEKLRNMPKLTIPVSASTSVSHASPAGHHSATPRTVVTPTLRRSKTPISAIRYPAIPHSANPASRHERASRNLLSPSDVYGLTSPFSELDVPVTSIPQDPLDRDTSHLAMYKSEESYLRHSKALEYIDIDDYAVACSTAVSGKKLGAGFFRGALGRSGSVSKSGHDGSKSAHPGDYKSGHEAFGFQLIPISEHMGGRKGSISSSTLSPSAEKAVGSNTGGKDGHFFAVGTRDERIDWMRELMLAKALKKGREITGGVEGARFECDGEVII